MKTIKPGLKVKVYISKREWAYGETIGVNDQGQIMLISKPSFKDLRTSDFNLFRNYSEVVFTIPHAPEHKFKKPVKFHRRVKGEVSEKKKRMLRNLLTLQQQGILDRSEAMDAVECSKRLQALKTLLKKSKSIKP
jgi:hypothetical protein